MIPCCSHAIRHIQNHRIDLICPSFVVSLTHECYPSLYSFADSLSSLWRQYIEHASGFGSLPVVDHLVITGQNLGMCRFPRGALVLRVVSRFATRPPNYVTMTTDYKTVSAFTFDIVLQPPPARRHGISFCHSYIATSRGRRAFPVPTDYLSTEQHQLGTICHPI